MPKCGTLGAASTVGGLGGAAAEIFSRLELQEEGERLRRHVSESLSVSAV